MTPRLKCGFLQDDAARLMRLKSASASLAVEDDVLKVTKLLSCLRPLSLCSHCSVKKYKPLARGVRPAVGTMCRKTERECFCAKGGHGEREPAHGARGEV